MLMNLKKMFFFASKSIYMYSGLKYGIEYWSDYKLLVYFVPFTNVLSDSCEFEFWCNCNPIRNTCTANTHIKQAWKKIH